jgi:hypothetical protein
MQKNITWTKRTCPLCDSTNTSSKAEVRAKFPAEESSWEQVKDAFVGIRNDQIFFSFYRCLDCGLLYCPWYFTKEQLDALYSEMPDNTMGEDKRTASKTQSRYARKIVKISGNISSFLEIGPDIGLVAKEVVTLANAQKVFMVEPNASVHQELSQNLEKSKHQEICTDVEKLTENKFDLPTNLCKDEECILDWQCASFSCNTKVQERPKNYLGKCDPYFYQTKTFTL